MAQDFGDDMGDMLFQGIKRFIMNRWRDAYNDRRYERRMEQKLQERESEGHQARDDAAVDTSAPTGTANADTVAYVPFGSANDAAYFAAVARGNDIEVDALSDTEGNGYVRFSVSDTDRLQNCCKEFSEAMGRLKEAEIVQGIEHADRLNEQEIGQLTEIKDLPDVSSGKTIGLGDTHVAPPVSKTADTSLDAVERGSREASNEINHTKDIAEKVMDARDRCQNFDDFKELLAERGIGVTTTKDGENMFYEARRDEAGRLLPFGRDDEGKRDWAVGAKTLKKNWEVDATHDWFEKNTPKGPGGGPGGSAPMAERESRSVEDERTTVAPKRDREPQIADGSLDTDGRTPDINQGIESHDGMDTDTRTLKLEREQNGTDVAPSKVREEQAQARGDDRSLSAVSEQCRAASKQLETESGIADRDIDISDKLSPVR